MGTTRAVPGIDFPYQLTRIGVIMSPEDGNPLEVDGRAEPRVRSGSPRGVLPAAPAGGRGQCLPDRLGQDHHDRRGADLGDPRGRGAGAGPELGTGRRSCRGRGPASDLDRGPRRARDDLCRVRAAGAADGGGHLDRPADVDPARTGALRLRRRVGLRPQPVPQQGHRLLRRTGPRSGRHAEPGGAAPADVGSGRDEPRPGPAATGRAARSAGRDLDLLRPARRGRS